MKFSICIPNFNYAQYISETISSVLAQGVDLEVLVCDNASEDQSFDVVQAIADPRIHLSRNRWNVGFAGNLDRACLGATGDWQLLLSSDDVMAPNALVSYQSLITSLHSDPDKAIICAGQYVIDADSNILFEQSCDPRLWDGAVLERDLSAAIGLPVRSISTKLLLRRSLLSLRTPFPFASTCYPKCLYDSVEGYSSGRLVNPDKAFAWKILSLAERAFYIDAPLFSYRVHAANQNAQQARAGALKHLVDQYVASFDTPLPILEVAGITREHMAAAFLREDIVLRGLKSLAEGRRRDARRAIHFAKAAYPDLAKGWAWLALWTLVGLGPLGSWIAGSAYRSAFARWAGQPVQ